MGFSKKVQVEGGLETDGKKWVIAGISFRTCLRPINTSSLEKCGDNEEDECSTTPTAEEARIPKILPCPPAPKKRRPSSKCYPNGVREFFSPPDLDSLFALHVEKAK